MGRDDRRARRRGGRDGARRAGFTLVEMLIVITMIGILVGMAAPKIDANRYRMDAGAQVVRTAMQRAQRQAIAGQRNVFVSFDVVKHRVRVAEDANSDFVLDATERSKGTWRALEEGARYAAPPARLGELAAAGAVVPTTLPKTSDGYASVVFRRDGGASAEVEVYLSAGRPVDDDFRAVRLTPATGRADWFRRLNGAWKAGGM